MGSLPPATPGSPLIPLLPLFLAGLPGLVKGLGGQGRVTDESSVWIPVAWMRYQLCSAQDGAGQVPSESLSPGCLLGPRTARERPNGHSPWVACRPFSVQWGPASLLRAPPFLPLPSSLTPWHGRVSSAGYPESQQQQRLGTLRRLQPLPAGPHSFAREPPPTLALVSLQGLHVTCLF